ncbi:unnamed protein product [Toxocara canis]|uniref:SEA domain-containing protein n=1 Tax=Toxocara canis TaxID=6265 RepID=A0A183VG01_TOXCA|nr:unnamed protein product [Toxocara canis]
MQVAHAAGTIAGLFFSHYFGVPAIPHVFVKGYSSHKGALAADCSGSFSYPVNCVKEQCSYMVEWRSDGKDSSVRVIDYFAAGYGRPKIDSDQAIFGVSAAYDAGFIYANFSRSLISDDDHDLSIDQCVYFLYPVNGGDLEGGTGELRKHSETPISSTKKICLASCGRKTDVPSKKVTSNEAVLEASILPDETTHAPRATYEVIMRILNRDWNPRLSDGTTAEFRAMTNEVTKAVSSVIKPRWPSLKVERVTKFVKGSVVAHVILTSDDDNSPSAGKVKETIEEVSMFSVDTAFTFSVGAIDG